MTTPVPRVNRLVFGTFAGLLAAFVLAIAAWDAYLYARTGNGSETISWSVALLAASDPLVIHTFVLAVGLVVGGLLIHFFDFRMPNPGEVAKRERLRAELELVRAEVERLRGLAEEGRAELRGLTEEGRAELPGLTWESYNR